MDEQQLPCNRFVLCSVFFVVRDWVISSFPQGRVSVSDKTSYRKISQSPRDLYLESSDRSEICCDVAVKLQSDTNILTPNLAPSRLCEISRYNVLSDIEMGRRIPPLALGRSYDYHSVSQAPWRLNSLRPRDAYICVSKLNIIGSDIGLSPGRRQAIIWTNAGILWIGPLGTNFSELLIEIRTFSFKKMRLKMSSGKWPPFCLALNVLS